MPEFIRVPARGKLRNPQLLEIIQALPCRVRDRTVGPMWELPKLMGPFVGRPHNTVYKGEHVLGNNNQSCCGYHWSLIGWCLRWAWGFPTIGAHICPQYLFILNIGTPESPIFESPIHLVFARFTPCLQHHAAKPWVPVCANRGMGS